MTKQYFNYSHSDLVMELANLSWWFDKRQAQIWLFGTENKRDRRTEIALRRTSTRKRKALTAVRFENKLVYSKKKDPDLTTIFHGLGDTECRIRFSFSNREGEIIPGGVWRGCGLIPDGGIIYPSGSLLMWEFSTKSNVLYHKMIEGKLRAYESHFSDIEDKLHAKPGVVFVLDIDREFIKRKLPKWNAKGPFWFIDYSSFLDIPLGEALTTPLYFRPDGTVEAIKK